ncbi:MAG: hypothetical protein P8X98_16330 [Woeseiaceae bacterium]
MNFFSELRRRNVFRVGIAYLIVAWLLLQVADTLGPALRLPEWFQSGVVFVLILGFPFVLIFAWAFELTPEGLKREKEVDRGQSITGQTGQKLNYTIIGLLLVAVLYLGLDKFAFEHDHEEQRTASTEPSIAVLPFANMSDDASNEFFADGITEELLNLLAKIPELQVTSRTSAFQFKGREVDIPTVAKQLNVEHVLEGSVRKSGMRVRITAQLIDAETDRHVWSETYDRELDDIFAVQDEIAKEVVEVLQVALLGEAPKSRKTDTEAYALYLEGLHFLDLDRADDWPQALALFEQALEIDPEYASAWFGRARAIREIANWGDYDLDEGTELARQWARHALEIDPSLAEAWAMLGHLRMIYDWDWDGAQTLIDKALAVGPNNPVVLGEASILAHIKGDMSGTLEYALAALELDPLSNVRIREAGLAHWFRGEHAEAEAYFRKNEALHGEDAWPGDVVAALLMQGRYAEAEAATDALAARDVEYFQRFIGAYTYAFVGRKDEAVANREWTIKERGIPLGYQIAQIFTIHEDYEKAWEWLEISYDNKDGGLTYLLVDPWLEPLHDDPRWRELLEKMNLLEYWEAMQTHQPAKEDAPGAPI